MESFWARMQTELLNRRRWKTRLELSTEIFDWIADPKADSIGRRNTGLLN